MQDYFFIYALMQKYYFQKIDMIEDIRQVAFTIRDSLTNQISSKSVHAVFLIIDTHTHFGKYQNIEETLKFFEPALN